MDPGRGRAYKDDSALRFSISNSHKDISYYKNMAENFGVPSAALGILELFQLALKLNAGDLPVPHLADIIRKNSHTGPE